MAHSLSNLFNKLSEGFHRIKWESGHNDKKCETCKFILLLKKGVYPYEYMDDWEKVNETLSSKTEEFYNHLNMEDLTDADYVHENRVCNDSEEKP